MEPKEPFDFEAFKQEAIKGLYAGQSINGEKGIFAPLLKQLLEAALEGEMGAHLDQQERQQGNRRSARQNLQTQSVKHERHARSLPRLPQETGVALSADRVAKASRELAPRSRKRRTHDPPTGWVDFRDLMRRSPYQLTLDSRSLLPY
jgi:hypothetical protein